MRRLHCEQPVLEVIVMNTGYWVATIGAVVSLIGWNMSDTRFGAGVLGFGLAHVVLGLLDGAADRQRVPNE